MSAYAPPSHPPPGEMSSPGPSSSRYAPTTTPTPGQPLLRNGKMLVYPHGWRGCPKCRDTGYKQGDPTHPCRKCWQDYGQSFNPLLISTAGLQGAKVLQKPLPAPMGMGGGGIVPPGAYGPFPSTHNTGNAGFWGAMMAQQPTGHSYAGDPFSPPPQTFSPPTQPPPPATTHAGPPRRNPVNRTQDSREDDLNENGEAPPAYEDAVAAGPEGALPPQRAEEHTTGGGGGGGGGQSQTYAPPQQPPNHPTQQQPYIQQSYGQMHQQPYGQHYQSPPPTQGGPWGMPPPGAQMMPYGHRAPHNALVVRPGDPRIGGRLCYKCGGDGIREDFWFGTQETCRLCNGSGRILM